MTYRRVGKYYVLKLSKGEEVMETLKQFTGRYGITAGTISGIGAANDVTIGYFDTEKKEYVKQNFKGDFEILSLSGNISLVESDTFSHIHMILGDKNFNLKGGHLFSAVISVTCEIYIEALDTQIEREIDQDTGLNLLKL